MHVLNVQLDSSVVEAAVALVKATKSLLIAVTMSANMGCVMADRLMRFIISVAVKLTH